MFDKIFEYWLKIDKETRDRLMRYAPRLIMTAVSLPVLYQSLKLTFLVDDIKMRRILPEIVKKKESELEYVNLVPFYSHHKIFKQRGEN